MTQHEQLRLQHWFRVTYACGQAGWQTCSKKSPPREIQFKTFETPA